jgi:hypothetical protein
VVLRFGSDPFSVEPFSADSGSNVNISGGAVNPRFNARNGSLVNISGGLLYRLTVSQDSEVSISGGSFGRLYSPGEDTDIELIGGEFRLNGEDLDSSDSRIILAVTDTLTGTLADGSAFIFDGALHGVTLTAADLPTADLSPITVNSAVVSGPSGLRAGQTLTLQAGGSLRDNFAVVDAALNVEDGELADFAKAFKSVVNLSGGSIGESFYALDSVVDITGGTVGYGFRASGSEVNISGGSVGNRFDADAGSVVNISGGTVGSFFSAGTESVINISGGAIDDHLNASSGSEVNITGGTFGDSIRVTGGEVNLFGSEFQIDGAVLDTLLPGETFTIADRDITLSGVLADGTPFSFDLIGQSLSDNFFSPTATLTVTIAVPFLLGDCNEDGVVNVSDISSFIAILQSGSFLAQADCNQDDLVNFADISAFIGIILNL